jgi:hypothetical protein
VILELSFCQWALLLRPLLLYVLKSLLKMAKLLLKFKGFGASSPSQIPWVMAHAITQDHLATAEKI